MGQWATVAQLTVAVVTVVPRLGANLYIRRG
jgi:hypothetical protein